MSDLTSTDLTGLTPSEAPRPVAPLHVVLHQPEIAPNTGAVGRTCVAIGATLWLVRPLGFRIEEKRLRRAGLDYWQFLTVEIVDDWAELTARLPVERFWYLTTHGQQSIYDVTYSPGDVLVMGSESRGLPAAIRDAFPERRLRIPTTSDVRSLNLSCAVAVTAYEAIRQFGGTLPRR